MEKNNNTKQNVNTVIFNDRIENELFNNLTIAEITLDNEEKEVIKITWDDFLEMIREYLSDTITDERFILYKSVLDAIISASEEHEEWSSDERGRENLEKLKQLYSMTVNNKKEFVSFLSGDKEFFATPRPAGSNDLLSIFGVGKTTEIIERKFENSSFIINGNLGIDEQKILELIKIVFCNNNAYGAQNNLYTTVAIPLTETMRMCGKTITKDNKKKFVQLLKKEILPKIDQIGMEVHLKNGSFLHCGVGGHSYGVDTKNDIILFRVNNEYATYLNKAPLSLIYKNSLYLGTSKNPLPYYINVKLQDHYFRDGNIKKKTNNILSIKTLLKFAGDIIPTYEKVQETDRGHWIKRIKKPLEDALDEITEKGIFRWEYCKAGLKEVSEEEKNTNIFTSWEKLYITFELIPNEPDQTERLENKNKRLAEYAKKKELEEAKAIIKADNIKKRGNN